MPILKRSKRLVCTILPGSGGGLPDAPAPGSQCSARLVAIPIESESPCQASVHYRHLSSASCYSSCSPPRRTTYVFAAFPTAYGIGHRVRPCGKCLRARHLAWPAFLTCGARHSSSYLPRPLRAARHRRGRRKAHGSGRIAGRLEKLDWNFSDHGGPRRHRGSGAIHFARPLRRRYGTLDSCFPK